MNELMEGSIKNVNLLRYSRSLNSWLNLIVKSYTKMNQSSLLQTQTTLIFRKPMCISPEVKAILYYFRCLATKTLSYYHT